ncbi:MAG: MFS transporter [Clostridia bacterium]|nr:MFS transporter [Clostridia bacterium]
MSEDESYKSERRQYISMIICWLAYTSACVARFSYSANIASIETDYDVNNASAGLVMTFFAAAYGAGQFIHGALCRHYPRRQIVPIALIVVSAINLSLFFGVPFGAIKYLWLVSAVFQSILWPMSLQIISENVGKKLMPRAVLLMSTTTSLGTFLVYGVSAVFVGINYRLTFAFCATLLFAFAIIWYISYKPGHFVKDKKAEESNTGKSKDKFIYILFPVILLGLFSLATNFMKDGIQTFVPVIIGSIKKMPDSFSLLLSLVLPLFGIFGSVMAVALNKKIPKAIPLCLFFFGFISLFNLVVLLFGKNLFVTVISFGILELLLHGNSIVIVSIFPLAMREKMGSGALAGILNGAAYVGTALSTFLLGKIADVTGGWSAVFATLFGVAMSSVIFATVYLLFSVKQPKLNI